MDKWLLKRTLLGILILLFCVPSTVVFSSEKVTPPETRDERRNEYSEARPRDDIRPGTDKQLPGVRAFRQPAAEAQRLFDNGPITLKPLVILMDFPDYRYTDFNVNETHPLYIVDSWEADHYNEMLFNDLTYIGPNGEDFISFNQYYVQESRGMLSVKGDVFGWFTAANNAATYGANQTTASWLVVEAIETLALQQGVDLTEYDLVDFFDVDGDGIVLEKDGYIDTIIVIHAGRGEEWFGGGYLGADAIWPFRGKISYYNETETPLEVVDTFGNHILANDFVIVEQDTPLGLVAHEYGHSLELPDLYDGVFGEEPVQHWTLMAGSYTGEVIGSMPIALGAYCREQMQTMHGGNWQKQRTMDLNDLTAKGVDVTLDAATDPDPVMDAVRVDLPMKETVIAVPFSGVNMYFSSKGDNLRNSMVRSFDFTAVGSANSIISLEFKTSYDIETDWDYASAQVLEEGSTTWVPIAGNITTTTNPNDTTPNDPTDRNPGHGITGSTFGEWIDAVFDLSAYAGKKIDLKFYYWTDSNTAMPGMYIDDLSVKVDGLEIFFDDAEGAAQFALDGFTLDDGIVVAEHYYLIEWRNHQGVDEGLKYTHYKSSQTPYDPGLLIWYVDRTYGNIDRLDQDTYSHPGHLSVGIVDADQKPVVFRYYSDGSELMEWADRQMHDAGFGLMPGDDYFIDWGYGETIDKDTMMMHPVFDDGRDFSSPDYPMAGLLLPQYGLQVFVTEESTDRSRVKLHIRKGDENRKRFGRRGKRNQRFVESISVHGDKIIVETDKKMGDDAFIGFISVDGLNEKGVDLIQIDDDAYAGTVDDPDLLNGDLWKVNFIVLENKAGGRNAVFNSEVYSGFGAPLRIQSND